MPIRVDREDTHNLTFSVGLDGKEMACSLALRDGGLRLVLHPEGRDVQIQAPMANFVPVGPDVPLSVAEAYQLIARTVALLRDDSPAVVMCRDELITRLYRRAGLLGGAS